MPGTALLLLICSLARAVHLLPRKQTFSAGSQCIPHPRGVSVPLHSPWSLLSPQLCEVPEPAAAAGT